MLAQCSPSPSSTPTAVPAASNINPLIVTTTTSTSATASTHQGSGSGYQGGARTGISPEVVKKKREEGALFIDDKSSSLNSFVKYDTHIDFGRVRKMLDELVKLNCVGSFQSRFKLDKTSASSIGESLAYNFLSEHDDSEPMDRVTFAHIAQLVMLSADVSRHRDKHVKPQSTLMQRYLPEVSMFYFLFF